MKKVSTEKELKGLDGKPLNGEVEAFIYNKENDSIIVKDGSPLTLVVNDPKLSKTFKSVVVRCLRIEGNSKEMSVTEKLDYYDLIMKIENKKQVEFSNSEIEIIKNSLKHEDILIIGQINEMIK